MPVFIAFWVFLICTIFRNKFYSFITTIFPFLVVAEDDPEENLDNFFTTLRDEDR